MPVQSGCTWTRPEQREIFSILSEIQTLQVTAKKDGYLFNIRECTKAEALEILQDQSVCRHLENYPHDIMDVELNIINEKAVLAVIPCESGAEIHVACKYKDRAGIKPVFRETIDWLKSRGFEHIITYAPNGRKSLINMLKSLGFRQASERWIC